MNSERDSNTTLRDRPLVLAEITWISAAVLTLGVLVFNLPARFDQLLHAGRATEFALKRLGLTLDFYAVYFTAFEVASMLTFAVIAALIFWRKSDDWMTVFVSLTLLSFGAIPSPMHTQVTTGWPVLFVQALGSGSFLIFLYLFPDGRFVPQWTRTAAVVAAAWALSWPFFPAVNPYTWPFPLPFVAHLCWFGTGVYAQLYRYTRVSNPVQQQTKWVVFGLTAAVAGDFVTHLPTYILPPTAPGISNVPYLLFHQPFFVFSQMLVPLTIAVSMARYRLWDIDLVIRRTLVYGSLSAVVVGIYALVVGALGALFQFQTRGNLLLSVVATGLVAVIIQPLRRRLQRGVTRLLYGQRDDPVAVLAQLGRRVEAVIAPEGVLPTIVETAAQALKLPYAAIAVKQGDKFEIVAEYTSPPTLALRATHPPAPNEKRRERGSGGEVFPLLYQAETIGRLIVAPRAPGEALTTADRQLLEEIAHQASAAVHAVRLTADLQHSRERLVTAREEERRRLRRDLHDSLGPTLASHALKLEAALDLLATDPSTGSAPDPAAARALLVELKSQTQAVVADIRRLVYDLRPPALDELGLVSALREHVVRYAGASNGLRVVVEAPLQGLPPLSAAVEVAAYRIALEALTNVARHARAHRCVVRISVAEPDDRHAQGDRTGSSQRHQLGMRQGDPVVSGQGDHIGSPLLELEIADDGLGLPRDVRGGVGMASMRERAAELGGTCVVEPVPSGGTHVLARLPLYF